MGFRSARNADRPSETDQHSQLHGAGRSSPDHESESDGWFQRMPLEEANAEYGIPDDNPMLERQRLEASTLIRANR